MPCSPCAFTANLSPQENWQSWEGSPRRILAAMAEFIPPADPKREEPINKLAAVTKPLLPSKDPAQEKKEAKDPEEHKDRTVISTRRGRI